MPVGCPMIFGSMRQSQVGQVSPAIEAGGAIDIKNASRTEFKPTILLRIIFIVFYQVNAAQEVILQICRMLYLISGWMTS